MAPDSLTWWLLTGGMGLNSILSALMANDARFDPPSKWRPYKVWLNVASAVMLAGFTIHRLTS